MSFASDDGAGGVHLRVRAIPGASRNEIAGPLGDRLKIRVQAPPEDGKANRSIQRLLAEALGIGTRDVALVSGPASAEKLFRVHGMDSRAVMARLARSYM